MSQDSRCRSLDLDQHYASNLNFNLRKSLTLLIRPALSQPTKPHLHYLPLHGPFTVHIWTSRTSLLLFEDNVSFQPSPSSAVPSFQIADAERSSRFFCSCTQVNIISHQDLVLGSAAKRARSEKDTDCGRSGVRAQKGTASHTSAANSSPAATACPKLLYTFKSADVDAFESASAGFDREGVEDAPCWDRSGGGVHGVGSGL